MNMIEASLARNAKKSRNEKAKGVLIMATKLITDEQWAEISLPVYWIAITYPEWENVHYEIATKWAAANCSKWVYRRDTTFMFGEESDLILFKLWVSGLGDVSNGEIT